MTRILLRSIVIFTIFAGLRCIERRFGFIGVLIMAVTVCGVVFTSPILIPIARGLIRLALA